MSNGPSLRRRPVGNSAADLERLNKLDEWTSEPASPPQPQPHADAPVSSGEGQGGDPVEPLAPAPAPVSAPTPARPAYPWVGVTGMHQVNFRLPTKLHLQLKWLSAQSTTGETMTEIIMAGLTTEIERRLKEQGVHE